MRGEAAMHKQQREAVNTQSDLAFPRLLDTVAQNSILKLVIG
jgi:hypothetical protein